MPIETIPSHAYRRNFLLCVMALAALLRFGLASVNRQSMDDHYNDVVAPLLEGRVPVTTIGKYHPKFFHITSVMVIKSLGVKGDLNRIRACQKLNAIVGTLTLLLVLLFLSKLDLEWRIQKWIMLCLSFSPAYLAFNAQVSNDTFVIFFSVLATFCVMRLFTPGISQRTAVFALFLGCIALYLAISTKGNGIVIAICAILFSGIMLAMAIYRRDSFILPFAAFAFFGVTTIHAIKHNSVYFYHPAYYRTVLSSRSVVGAYTGLPKGVATDSPRAKAILTRAFLSFPLGSLLERPVNDFRAPFGHMFSYWAQVYGNGAFTRFHYWPPTWRKGPNWLLWVGRLALILTLVPILLLFQGLWHLLGNNQNSRAGDEIYLGRFACLITIAFIFGGMRYFMIFPSFPFAKFIYIAPFLGGAVYCLAWGMKQAAHFRGGILIWPLEVAFYSLALVNITDVVTLICNLRG